MRQAQLRTAVSHSAASGTWASPSRQTQLGGMALFAPFGDRAARPRSHVEDVHVDGCIAKRRMSGPSTLAEWVACWRVWGNCMLILKAARPGQLAAYEKNQVILNAQYPDQYGIQLYADYICRHEEWVSTFIAPRAQAARADARWGGRIIVSSAVRLVTRQRPALRGPRVGPTHTSSSYSASRPKAKASPKVRVTSMASPKVRADAKAASSARCLLWIPTDLLMKVGPDGPWLECSSVNFHTVARATVRGWKRTRISKLA